MNKTYKTLFFFILTNQLIQKENYHILYARYVQPGFINKKQIKKHEKSYKKKEIPYIEIFVFKNKSQKANSEKKFINIKISEFEKTLTDKMNMDLITDFKIYLKKNLYDIPILDQEKIKQYEINFKFNLIYLMMKSEFTSFEFKFKSIFYDENVGMTTQLKPFFLNEFWEITCLSKNFKNNMVFLSDHYDPIYYSNFDTDITINIFENCHNQVHRNEDKI